MDGLPPGWRSLTSFCTFAAKLNDDDQLTVAHDTNGTPLPYNSGTSWLNNQQLDAVLLRFYHAAERDAALRFYKTLKRLSVIKNVIKCTDLLIDGNADPPTCVLALQPLSESLHSFLSRHDRPNLQTRAPERDGESKSIWSPMIVGLLRGFAKTLDQTHLVRVAHGRFNVRTTYVETNYDVAEDHPDRLVLKLSFPDHPSDLYEGVGQSESSFTENVLRKDWSLAADMVEQVGYIAGIDRHPLFIDLINEMKHFGIINFRNFLAHPSLWLPHHKINFMLKIMEPCKFWQFKDVLKKFTWKKRLQGCFGRLPENTVRA